MTTPVSPSRKRSCPFGALSAGRSGCAFYEKADGKGFCDFLSLMHDKHGRFVMYLDNAGCHKSKTVRKEVAKYDGDVIQEYFLPYAPELNPVEIRWRGIKKGTANTMYKDTGAIQESIRAMPGNGGVRTVKMADYLT